MPHGGCFLSGAREDRLRKLDLERLSHYGPCASEAKSIISGEVRHRVNAAPLVGHVGMLRGSSVLGEPRNRPQ
jgi:hypothetical protein